MRSVDNVSGVNKALHDYNNAKARGNKQDMWKALMAAIVELSDYENKANKSKTKREINGLLKENGMKTIDRAIKTMDAATPLLNAVKRKDSELKKRAKQYIQELKTIKDKKEFETKKRKYYLEIESEARDLHDAFSKEADMAMSAAAKLRMSAYLIEGVEFNG